MAETTQLIGNRYELLKQLGEGGMGAVYLALDRLTGETVALKRVIISEQPLDDQATVDDTSFRLALAREFQTLATLRHPHIIEVLDYGFDSDRQPYFTMELIHGASSILQAAKNAEEIPEQIKLIIQLLQALAYLHRRGVLHRDLKPANVLVEAGSQVKVLDFGLAIDKPKDDIGDDALAGTIPYLAPELLQGESPSEASDLFAVGIMLYEMLAGQHPFAVAGEGVGQIIQRIVFDQPDLEPIIERLRAAVDYRRELLENNMSDARTLPTGEDSATRRMDMRRMDTRRTDTQRMDPSDDSETRAIDKSHHELVPLDDEQPDDTLPLAPDFGDELKKLAERDEPDSPTRRLLRSTFDEIMAEDPIVDIRFNADSDPDSDTIIPVTKDMLEEDTVIGLRLTPTPQDIDLDGDTVVDIDLPHLGGAHRGGDAAQEMPALDFGDEDADEDKTAYFGKGTPANKAITLEHRAVEQGGVSDMRSFVDDDADYTITSNPLSAMMQMTGIVSRLLHKDAGLRYQDSYDVIADLARALSEPMPEESAAIRESFLQAAAFIGRELELVRLEDALKSAENGRGSAWLIGGESGVGKTRLLEELRIRALVSGFIVLRGQAVAEGGLTYQVFREPLRRLVLSSPPDDVQAGILKDIIPDMDHLLQRTISPAITLTGSAYQQRLAGAIAALFQQQGQPVMLMAEDLQWAQESLDLLQMINGMTGSLRLMIVGSYRTEDRPDLPDALPEMKHVHLDRLSETSVAALAESMMGPVGRRPEIISLLQRETEGNVFFLIEIVRALADAAGRLDAVGTVEIPNFIFAGGIQDILKRRLARVPDDMMPLLRFAALAGRDLDLKVLEKLRHRIKMKEWLTTCANVGVLEIRDGQWQFAHDKLRTAMLDTIPEYEQIYLHKQIAEAMEKVYPHAPEQAATIAAHWRQAGEEIKERIYVERAGEHALHISAFVDARQHFERAIDLLHRTTLDEHIRRDSEAALNVKLGTALQYIGDYPEATRRLETALISYRIMERIEHVAEVLVLLGDVLWRQGQYDRATKVSEEGLRLADALGASLTVARALNRLGMLQFEQGDYEQAKSLLSDSLERVRGLNDITTLTSVLNNLGAVSLATGAFEAAESYFNETLKLGEQSGQRRAEAFAMLNLGASAGEQDDMYRASEYMQRSLELFRLTGEHKGTSVALTNLGVIAEMNENFEDALRYHTESYELAEATGNRLESARALMSMGYAARAQNNPRQAIDYFKRALKIAHQIDAVPTIGDVIDGLAPIIADKARAARWLKTLIAHPSVHESTRKSAGATLIDLPEAEAGDLQSVVQEILSDDHLL